MGAITEREILEYLSLCNFFTIIPKRIALGLNALLDRQRLPVLALNTGVLLS